MLRTITFLGLFVLISWEVGASIFCPHDKSMVCSDDIYDFDRLGRPILAGNSLGKQARFIDNDQRNSCNVGYIYRRWYVDENNDFQWQPTELECTQTLYFAYEDYPISIQFPPNKVYSCKEDIKYDKPTWVTGPCNVIGLSYKDDVFEVSEDACYKILRKFKLIDWCDADGDGIMNTWEHTQIIKVIDEDAPVLTACQYQEFGVDSDCKAKVILTNAAMDDTSCGNQKLTWIVQVDLWANGDTDLEFSYAKSGDFYLKPTENNEMISVVLPDKIGLGKHKVHWSVRDECGNIRSCHTEFKVVDNKPPTPYVHTFLTASFDASSMPLMVPARIFNVNSFDNCSPKKYLTYSFSPDVLDTIRIVDCTNAGFQFYTLYITDQAGNQEYIDVFLLAFDNGSCNGIGTLVATLSEGNGGNIPGGRLMASRVGAEVEAVKGNDQLYVFEGLDLYADYQIRATGADLTQMDERVNVVDLVWLQEYIVGKNSLENFQWVAADMNRDGRISSKDAAELRKRIIRGFSTTAFEERYKVVFEPGIINSMTLPQLKEKGEAMKYDGSFDFKAILLGDISTANDVPTENRHKALVTIRQTAEGIAWVAASDVSIKGFQWDLFIQNPQAIIRCFGNNPEHWQTHRQENGVTRILATDKDQWSAGETILEISGVNPNEVQLLESSGWLTELGIFERINQQAESENHTESLLYPNPVADQHVHITTDHRVVRISNAEGRTFRFSQMANRISFLDDLPGGWYLVQASDDFGNLISAKFYKR